MAMDDRHVFERRARAAFVDSVAEFLRRAGGATDAEMVAAYYVQEGVAKFDGSVYSVKNGMFLDNDVLIRALAIAKAAARKAKTA